MRLLPRQASLCIGSTCAAGRRSERFAARGILRAAALVPGPQTSWARIDSRNAARCPTETLPARPSIFARGDGPVLLCCEEGGTLMMNPLRRLLKKWFGWAPRTEHRRGPRGRLQFEHLEDRLAPAGTAFFADAGNQ